MEKEDKSSVAAQPEATTPSGLSDSTPMPPPGVDTTFFMSRGGRQLMTAPLNELLAITERLAMQAQALKQESMIPELQKIASAARRLVEKFNQIESGGTTKFVLSPLLTNLIEARPGEGSAAIPPLGARDRILIVDDDPESCTVVSLLLEQRGYRTSTAQSGEQGLKLLREQEFHLVLLDLLMPEMNGFQMLTRLRGEPSWREVPVIIVSGVSDMSTVVRAIEMGADDFLPKPFNPVLLRARVEACLEKKHLRDQEAAYLKQIQSEREKADRLLLNILPAPIAARLKQGEHQIADSFSEVSVLFADLAGFSRLATTMPATELVDMLNEVFTAFDELAAQRGLEKIKTIGDAYMVVAGVPTPRADHAEAIADMALAMSGAVAEFNRRHAANLGVRMGIHTGPVVAGIIGRNKFAYDLWGDTVNVASRMESHGQVGCIQVTTTTHERLKSKFAFQKRGSMEIRGLGLMDTFFLTGRL